jgi:hypothetical protein
MGVHLWVYLCPTRKERDFSHGTSSYDNNDDNGIDHFVKCTPGITFFSRGATRRGWTMAPVSLRERKHDVD